jgi:hypothetical protein
MIVEYEPSRMNGPLIQVAPCIHIDSNGFLISDYVFWPTLLYDKQNPAYDKVMAEIENTVKPYGVDVFWNYSGGNRWVGLRKSGSAKADINRILKAYETVKDTGWTFIVYPKYLSDLEK